MSRVSARAARRERQGAEMLGTTRVVRTSRYERAPDAVPIRLKDGTVLQPECKSREVVPKWLLDSQEQARGYTPGAVPLTIIAPLGGELLALLPLKDLARILGIQPPKAGEQLLLGKE